MRARRNVVLAIALGMVIAIGLVETARAEACPPSHFRVLAASPVDEIRLDDLTASGNRHYGRGEILLDDASRVPVSVKVKSSRGKLKYRIRSTGSPRVKIDFRVRTSASGHQCQGKLKVKGPDRLRHKLRFIPGDVVVVEGEPPTETEIGPARWTYMVYMGADNNLTPFGLNDLREMESVGSDGNVNVVVQAEFSRFHDTGELGAAYGGDTLRMRVQRGANSLDRGTSIGNVDMAAPETLAEFIRWAAEAYPADRYALVLWSHGSGWRQSGLTRGAVQDDTSGGFMSLPDLARGVRDSGVSLEVIDFDACLMGMHEVAFEFRGLCDAMVFSEESEPGDGNPYHTILADLRNDPGMGGRDLAILTVERFGEFYGQSGSWDITKSAVDMTRIPALQAAVGQLAETIVAEIDAVRWAVTTSLEESQGYAEESHRDLYDFCVRLASRVDGATKTAAVRVMDEIERTVILSIHEGVSVADSHGLAIFAPLGNERSDPTRDLETYAQLAGSQGEGTWIEVVRTLLSDGFGSLVPGGFAFTITWDTDADVDLGIVEPDETTVWSHSTEGSENGTLYGDLDGRSEELYVANEYVEPGEYTPVIYYYADGSSDHANVSLYHRARGGERVLLGTVRLSFEDRMWTAASQEARGGAEGPGRIRIGPVEVRVIVVEKP